MYKKILLGVALATLISTTAEARIEIVRNVDNVQIQDHYKNVIKKYPYSVEVCTERNSDKTADTILGAIIGGAIGQNITKDLPDGATAGAIIGGLLGHQNSESGPICKKTIRYNEKNETIYSHSTITFLYEGKKYNVRFKR